MISSAEPPEKHLQAALSTAKIRVVVADLEDIAPALAASGETELAAYARRLSSQLYALLRLAPAAPSTPPPATTPNTGV